MSKTHFFFYKNGIYKKLKLGKLGELIEFGMVIVKAPTQLQFNISWGRHKNYFANPTPPHPQKLYVPTISAVTEPIDLDQTLKRLLWPYWITTDLKR